jgi:hypothetical protein
MKITCQPRVAYPQGHEELSARKKLSGFFIKNAWKRFFNSQKREQNVKNAIGVYNVPAYR